jgi:hypothetical protein
MACSTSICRSKRPGKFRQFETALGDPSDLVAMDGNHRFAGLMLRRLKREPDLLSEVIVYVCR